MKNKRLNYIIILIIMLGLIIITKGTNIFGSMVDWNNQHLAFAEYFRNIYLETHSLTNTFALNIGAGTNIFNLSYYGLFNPLLMISYLIPNISMTTYLSGLNTILYLITGILFYYFLSKKNNDKYALTEAILFIVASPILFHFHRQFMFVNYLPFLLLSFIGIDKDKKWIVILSSFLIIMSSYYFAIPSFIAIIIYYLYKKGVTFKNFILSLIPLLIASLMSAFLTFPTLITILSNRSNVVNTTPFYTLFLPNISFQPVLYNPYTMGLTIISVISLLVATTIKNNKLQRLSISLLIVVLFGIFAYAFNGFLYVRSKSLIPFIPLIILVVVEVLRYLNKHKYKNKILSYLIIAIILIILLASILTNSKYLIITILDLSLTILGLYLYKKKHTMNYLLVIIISISILNCYLVNKNEEYMSLEDAYSNSSINELINTVDNTELFRTSNLIDRYNTVNKIYNNNYLTTSIYSSTENSYYFNFIKNIFDLDSSYDNSFIINTSSSIIFNTIMGNRYLIDYNNKNYLGYELLTNNDSYSIYENNNTLPLIYATNRLYSESVFDTLPYQSKMATIVNGVITKDTKSDIPIKNSNNYLFKGTLPFTKNSTGKYILDFDKASSYIIPLNDTIIDKSLIITFVVNKENCQEGERTIEINGVKNSISCDNWLYANHNYTFTYHLSNANITDLNVVFSKGHFEIEDIELSTIDYQDIKEYVASTDKMENIKYKNDTITGTINITNSGYLVTSLPYDDNFNIYIDDNLVNKEIVNEGFLGAKITNGNHSIKIVYELKYNDIFKVISALGIMIFITVFIRESREYNDPNKGYKEES